MGALPKNELGCNPYAEGAGTGSGGNKITIMDSKEISSLPKSDVKALAAGEPLHMDKFSRNERLYKHLLEIGAVVEPIYSDFSMRRIDYLKVSAASLEH